MNLRNLLVGANLSESLDMLMEAVKAGNADRAGWIKEFICDYYRE